MGKQMTGRRIQGSKERKIKKKNDRKCLISRINPIISKSFFMIINRKGLKKEKYQMKMKETVNQIKKFTFLKNFEDYRLTAQKF